MVTVRKKNILKKILEVIIMIGFMFLIEILGEIIEESKMPEWITIPVFVLLLLGGIFIVILLLIKVELSFIEERQDKMLGKNIVGSCKKGKVKPEKLKENLIIFKEISDGYYYSPTYRLTCCKKNSFKFMVNGNSKKSILGGITLVSKDEGLCIKCSCLECNKEYEVFNSTKDGYDGYVCNDKIVDFELEEFKCNKCHESDFDVEITYEYADDKEQISEIKDYLKEDNKDDFTNTYFGIVISIKCNKCGKEYKRIVEYECA